MYATYPTDYQFHQKYMMSKIDFIVYSLHSILFGAKLQQNSLTTRIIILFFTKKKYCLTGCYVTKTGSHKTACPTCKAAPILHQQV